MKWVLAAFLLAAVTLLVYWPGLTGGYLLDDESNLSALYSYGAVRDLDSLLFALGNGFAGPLGRPVSLVSFLLNESTLPASPWELKFTNLCLHAVNGALLFWLVACLSQMLEGSRRQAFSVALLAASAWVLHPLWVSTTLYVVQRMAILATTFSLLALLLFVYGRAVAVRGRPVRGVLLVAIGLGGFGSLALLSKENAGLLPMQMLAMEFFLFRSPQLRDRFGEPGRLYRGFVLIAFLVPALILLGWLAARLPIAEARMNLRGATMPDRVLTEARVMMEYLRLILLPTDRTPGVFYDHVRPSTGLLTPLSTLPSVIAVCALWVLPFLLRRRHALLAFGIGFFMISHLVETWFIALEYAFEHRNYLAALFLPWPLARLALSVRPRKLFSSRFLPMAATLVVLLLATLTFSRAVLWGQPLAQAEAWARINPQSVRAQGHVITLYMQAGRYEEAAQQAGIALRHNPDDPVLAVGAMQVACFTGTDGGWVERAEAALENRTIYAQYVYDVLGAILARIESGLCDVYDLQDLERLVLAVQRNPTFHLMRINKQYTYHLLGQIHLLQGNGDAAFQAYRSALQGHPGLAGVLRSAAMLAARGYPAYGLELLEMWKPGPGSISYRGTGKSVALREQRRAYLLAELERLKKVLREEVRQQAAQQAS